MHSDKRRDATELDRLEDAHKIILNNEPGKATRPTRRKTGSIIDLKFRTPKVDALDTWVLDDELSAPSVLKVSFGDLANSDEVGGSINTDQEVTV